MNAQQRNRAQTERRRARNRVAYEAALAAGCADCGETDRDVLEFDHVPERGQKIANVRRFVQEGATLTALLAEIAKCDVVCANDHARRTRRRLENGGSP